MKNNVNCDIEKIDNLNSECVVQSFSEYLDDLITSFIKSKDVNKQLLFDLLNQDLSKISDKNPFDLIKSEKFLNKILQHSNLNKGSLIYFSMKDKKFFVVDGDAKVMVNSIYISNLDGMIQLLIYSLNKLIKLSKDEKDWIVLKMDVVYSISKNFLGEFIKPTLEEFISWIFDKKQRGRSGTVSYKTKRFYLRNKLMKNDFCLLYPTKKEIFAFLNFQLIGLEQNLNLLDKHIWNPIKSIYFDLFNKNVAEDILRELDKLLDIYPAEELFARYNNAFLLTLSTSTPKFKYIEKRKQDSILKESEAVVLEIPDILKDWVKEKDKLNWNLTFLYQYYQYMTGKETQYYYQLNNKNTSHITNDLVAVGNKDIKYSSKFIKSIDLMVVEILQSEIKNKDDILSSLSSIAQFIILSKEEYKQEKEMDLLFVSKDKYPYASIILNNVGSYFEYNIDFFKKKNNISWVRHFVLPQETKVHLTGISDFDTRSGILIFTHLQELLFFNNKERIVTVDNSELAFIEDLRDRLQDNTVKSLLISNKDIVDCLNLIIEQNK